VLSELLAEVYRQLEHQSHLSESRTKSKQAMNWDRYATAYDRMCRNNPSYAENLGHFLEVLDAWDLPAHPRVCDVGAGTGNYVCAMQQKMPDAHYTHIDSNPTMNAIAQEKYDQAGLTNVEIVTEYVQRLEFPENHFDLIVCVHSLYAMQPQEIILAKLRRWMKPSGHLFMIDFGRKQDVFDWGRYLFSEMRRKQGTIKACLETVRMVNVTLQNRNTTLGQERGEYWTHSTAEFQEALLQAGLKVEHIESCYRGYSDMAICSKDTVT
jgi:ubiquinone/menaquinone biosynthesis C-methylase UbiE